MTASWEKIEKNRVQLQIEVDADQVSLALDKAFKKVAAKINVPGFRKGKVPRGIFEAKFGVESLYQDALDIILPEAYMEAIEQHGIIPVDRPEVDVQQFAKGQALKFTATVAVKPEVTLGQYKGIEVPEKTNEVTAEEIQAELERLQQRHAELVVVEEGSAQNGDTVIIDFDGYVDGVAFEGGKAEKYSLELGSGSFIPGFEEQVVGLSPGNEKDIDVNFPDNYHSEDLKGKAALFKVKLHDIKRKNLPELDDEFAKDVSEFDTLDEFKEDIEKRLLNRKATANQQEIEAAVVEKAAEAADVEIPASMVETEQEQMYKDFANRLQMQGMNLDMYFQFSGQNEQTLKDQMKADAEKRVRNNLVLEAISKVENIEATEEELTGELEKMAEQYQRSIDEIRTILSANGNLEGLKGELTVKKTVEFLVENSKQVAPVA